jgi:hypothetical protein
VRACPGRLVTDTRPWPTPTSARMPSFSRWGSVWLQSVCFLLGVSAWPSSARR